MPASQDAVDGALTRALAGTPYRVVRLLGSGGMGSVVEAEHTGLAKRVAVKLLLEEMSDSPELADRMRIEAQALARIEHPNLVRVLDFGISRAGRPYLVMELLEGVTLAEELERRGSLPVAESLRIMARVADGLAAAQSVGLVHRDVKPRNLFLCRGPEPRTVKVLDFGITKVIEGAAPSSLLPPRFVTRSGLSVGTPRYSAPEQLSGAPVSPATDVYSVGIVLYECLTGTHPFEHCRSIEELYSAHSTQMPKPPSQVARQAIGPAVDRLVLRAMAKSPSDRYPSAAALSSEIAALLSGSEAAADSREAPTVQSEVHGVDATAATWPAQAEIVPVPAAPAAVASPPLPIAPAPLPPRGRGREGLGAFALVAGVAGVLWNVVMGVYELGGLIDPTGTLATLRAARSGASVDETLVRYTQIASGTELFRHLLLFSVGASLTAVAFSLLGRSPKAFRWVRSWSSGSLGAVALALLIDAAVVAPLKSRVFAEGAADTESPFFHANLVAAVGVIVVFHLVLALGVLVIRVVAGRLERLRPASPTGA